MADALEPNKFIKPETAGPSRGAKTKSIGSNLSQKVEPMWEEALTSFRTQIKPNNVLCK